MENVRRFFILSFLVTGAEGMVLIVLALRGDRMVDCDEMKIELG